VPLARRPLRLGHHEGSLRRIMPCIMSKLLPSGVSSYCCPLLSRASRKPLLLRPATVTSKRRPDIQQCLRSGWFSCAKCMSPKEATARGEAQFGPETSGGTLGKVDNV
jgi:hypothetical protein